MSCRKSKEAKFINRNSPPIPASNCKLGTIKKGNNGIKYYVGEVKSKSGTYNKWLKYKSSVKESSKSKPQSSKLSKKAFKELKCKKSEILKKGYIRKGYITKTGKKSKDVVINPKCVNKLKVSARLKYNTKSQNKSKNTLIKIPNFVPTEKNKGIGKLKRGELREHGYSKIKTLRLSNRHNALTKAVDDYGAHMVFRKLGALRTYQKYTNPLVSKLCHNNQKWIRKNFNHQFMGSWKNSKVFNK